MSATVKKYLIAFGLYCAMVVGVAAFAGADPAVLTAFIGGIPLSLACMFLSMAED